MSDLDFYIDRARELDEPGKIACLEMQWKQAVETREIRCICGLRRALELAFRCLYCGVWFCGICAGHHFGKSREKYRDEKRN